ncbi:MAG: hypothetical protein WBF93_13490 [Pirellulales bacterium]
MISNSGTFSADVKLHLYTDDGQFELGQLGPDFALLRSAREIFAQEGELETIIDGKSSRWKVRITSPITIASRRFTFEAVE